MKNKQDLFRGILSDATKVLGAGFVFIVVTQALANVLEGRLLKVSLIILVGTLWVFINERRY